MDPTSTFAALGAHPALAQTLAARDYHVPTPVQAAILGPKARDRDLLVSARTGSGKTVAFGLALAPWLLGDAERLGKTRAPLALVIAPTRELAQQVARELQWLYAGAGGRIATCVGGVDVRGEVRALAAGPHLVVGTPGRLCDHLDRGSLDLSGLRAVVLDEADEMLDMGFRDELLKLLGAAPSDRRTLMFSATLPKEIEELARKFQRDALRIAAGSATQAHADIEIRAHLVAPREREHAVVNVLRYHGVAGSGPDVPAAIVFCATREGTSHLAAALLERGFSAVPLSGELSQAERNRALKALRDGRARVLVATDVAARGLDLPDVGLVVQADPPQNAEALQHRSGRTGRAGRKGVSVLLVPPGARRWIETLLRPSGARAEWTPAPGPEVIRVRDRDALVREIDQLVRDPAEEDLQLARQILRERSAEELAAALVKVRREALPAPEDLALTAALVEQERTRAAARKAPARAPSRPGARPAHPGAHPTHPREPPERIKPGRAGSARDAPGGIWFRVNVGRNRNADPRWLLPILCRRGEVGKAQIGRIEVRDAETRFQVVPEAAKRFLEAAQRPDTKDPNIRITRVAEAPARRA